MSTYEIIITCLGILVGLHLLFDIFFVAYMYDKKIFVPSELKSRKECLNDICDLLQKNLSHIDYIIEFNRKYIQYLNNLDNDNKL